MSKCRYWWVLNITYDRSICWSKKNIMAGWCFIIHQPLENWKLQYVWHTTRKIHWFIMTTFPRKDHDRYLPNSPPFQKKKHSRSIEPLKIPPSHVKYSVIKKCFFGLIINVDQKSNRPTNRAHPKPATSTCRPSNRWQIQDTWDAMLLEMFRIPDARQHQELWGQQGAGAEDHLRSDRMVDGLGMSRSSALSDTSEKTQGFFRRDVYISIESDFEHFSGCSTLGEWISTNWLGVSTYPSEKWSESQLFTLFPIHGVIKFMFQTTNQ